MNTTDQTVECIFIKHGTDVAHDERMNPIDFTGQRSKVKVKKYQKWK